jgi:drug/metabolite transporter (DMT)-like permease
MHTYRGEIAALIVSVVWTATALVFSDATKRVGSMAVNYIKLFIGIFLMSIYCYIARGLVFPTDAGIHQWLWLSISGIIGFILCDLFLFKSFNMIGVRLSMLIMTLAPPLTALGGLIFLGERLYWMKILAILVTITGIALTIVTQPNGDKGKSKVNKAGVLFAFTGAVGQAAGFLFSKIGMQGYDPMASSQIRIIGAIVGFTLLILVLKRYESSWRALKNVQAMKLILFGSFFGPFIGVGLSLYSIQHANTGIASTLMAMVPVFIIFPSVYLYKQPITKGEIAGTIISIAGVALFFI